MMNEVNATQVADAMVAFIEGIAYTDPEDWTDGERDFAEGLGHEVNMVRTFEEAGVLTMDSGVVIKLADDAQTAIYLTVQVQ